MSLKRTEYSQCKLQPYFLSIVSDAQKKDVGLFCSITINFSLCLPLSFPFFSYSVHVGVHECICTCFWKLEVHLIPCHPSWVLSLFLAFVARSLAGWYSLIKQGYLTTELQLSDYVYPTSTGTTNPYYHTWLCHMSAGDWAVSPPITVCFLIVLAQCQEEHQNHTPAILVDCSWPPCTQSHN